MENGFYRRNFTSDIIKVVDDVAYRAIKINGVIMLTERVQFNKRILTAECTFSEKFPL